MCLYTYESSCFIIIPVLLSSDGAIIVTLFMKFLKKCGYKDETQRNGMGNSEMSKTTGC